MEIKCQLDATEVFIADLITCSTCFGYHYAHHQELKSIIQWLLPVLFGAVVFKLLVWCGAVNYVSGLQDAAISCKPADLIACSTCSGHHYAYHQKLKSIIQWLLPVVFRAVVFKLLVCRMLQHPANQLLENHSTKYHRQQPLYNTLELLMMGIVVPETC